MERFEEKVLAKSAKYLGKGKVEAAIELVQAALEKSPESAVLLLEMSRLQLRMGRREDAMASVRRTLKARGDGAEHVETFVADLRQMGEDVVPYHETLVEHHLRQRDMERALQTLERMRSEIPACRDRALPRAQKLISEAPGRPINPQLLPSVYLVALCHELTGQYQAAAQTYTHVLDRNPQEADVVLARMGAVLLRDHRNLGLRLRLVEGLLRQGKVKEAVEQASLALDIDASGAPKVASVLDRAAREAADPTALLPILARARATEGRVEDCLQALRPLVEKGHNLDSALRFLEDLARRYEEHAGILSLLSEVYLRRGKSREALAAFGRLSNPPPEVAEAVYRRILAADPGCMPAAQKLVALLCETGRAPEAGALCERALEIDPSRAASLAPQLHQLLTANPNDRKAHLLMARLQAQRGDRERAGVLLRRLLASDPESAGEVGAVLGSLPSPAEGAEEARHLRLACLEAALARGDSAAALAAGEAALAREPVALPDALAPTARLLLADPSCAPRLRQALAPHARRPGCEAALDYLAGECAAAEGNLLEALEHWKACAAARPEALAVVREALERERRRPDAPVELDGALIDFALQEGDFAAAARALGEIVARRPEAAASCLDRYVRLLREQSDNLDIRMGLCAAYAACRQYDQALALGEETARMEDSERTAPLHLTLAEVLAERGDIRRAIKRLLHAFARRRDLGPEVAERLERLRQRNPSQPLIHLALGRVLGVLERAEEAVDALAESWRLDAAQADLVLEELQKLQSRHTPGPVMRMLMARIWASKRDYGKATEAIGQLLDTHPDQARSVLLVADKILGEVADLADAHLVRGRALLAQGSVAAACESFEKAFRAAPDSAGRLIAWCQKAVEMDPSAPEPYLLACDLHRAQKRPAAAAEVLAAALGRGLPGRERFVQRLAALAEEHREDSGLLLTLAEEHLLAGNPEAALRALAEAVTRDATLSDAAVEAVERTLAAHPDLPDAYLVRARLRARRGKVDAALADAQEFLSRVPSRRAEALPVLAALRKRDPRYLAALTCMADILIEERRFEEAATLFKDALAGTADPAQKLNLYLRQWRLHLAQGKDALARQVLENAQALAPDRNLFLDSVHRMMVERARQGVEQLSERARSGAAVAADIEALVASLIALGESDEAREALSRHGALLERPRFARLHAALAERRGDYRRALEMGRSAGVDRRLVYCAERAGEYEEAHRLLARLVEEGREVALEPRLARYELQMLRRELDRDRNVLQAETFVAFGR